MKTLLFGFLFSTSVIVFCQPSVQNNDDKGQTIFESLESTASNQGEVVINQSFYIKNLINRHVELNRKFMGAKGYRIQIAFYTGTKGRNQSYKTKSDLVTQYPDLNVYIVFLQPYFKVRIGDFFSKSDALKALEYIKETYPSAFIVEDLIQFN